MNTISTQLPHQPTANKLQWAFLGLGDGRMKAPIDNELGGWIFIIYI
jgi:hypothetical protein